MRRLSAFLMIAALIAVMVPSAALAGKPVTTVDEVTVKGSVFEGSDTPPCSLTFWARFSGTVQTVRSTTMVGETQVGEPMIIPLARKQYSVGWDILPLADLATVEYTWKVELLGRKDKVLAQATTTPEKWLNAESCPSGLVVAGHPAWQYPT
jgi:hypothetical protein